MPSLKSVAVKIDVGKSGNVSSLFLAPPRPSFGYVFAHGAGAGMHHPFMETVAAELADRDVATLRYQFPYMEAGGKRPDPPDGSAWAFHRCQGFALQGPGVAGSRLPHRFSS